MLHEMASKDLDMDSFVMYLEQLQTYYCGFMVRFYGLVIRYKNSNNATVLTGSDNATTNATVGVVNSKNNVTNKVNTTNTVTTLANNSIESYLLVFDYHRCDLKHMLSNDMILDNMQIANIALQLMYFLNYLHTHEQPRCLGYIRLQDIYWPMAIVLPYMGVSYAGDQYQHA